MGSYDFATLYPDRATLWRPGLTYTGGNYGTSLGLASDGAKGAYTVTMNSVSGLSVGQYVLLDEKSGAVRLHGTRTYGSSINVERK